MASLNKPVRQKTMIVWGWEIYIAPKDARNSRERMWVFKEQELTFGGETQEDIYTNFKTKKIVQGDQVNLAFSYHELRPEIIEIINGGGTTRTNYNGVTAVVGHIYALELGEWSLDNYLALDLKNGNNTLVTITNITGSTDWSFAFGTLVAGTDYDIALDQFGGTVIRLKTGWSFTTANQTITFTYTVTPAKSDVMDEQSSYVPVGFYALLRWKGVDTSTGDDMVYELELESTTNDKAFPWLIGDSDESTTWLPCNFQGFVVKNGQRFINFQD